MAAAKHFVLIVDSDCHRGRSLVSYLRDAGCYAAGAWDGRDALRYVRENQPDAVVCDWRLEDMSGLELLRRIKEECFPTKVILTSDRANLQHLRRTLVNGGEDLLGRPYSPDLVLRTLGRSLEPVQAGWGRA